MQVSEIMASQHPPGLIQFGFISSNQLMLLKMAKIRVWCDPQYAMSHYGTLTWVEPWVIEAQKLFRNKRGWAGLSEIDFIVAMSPEKGK